MTGQSLHWLWACQEAVALIENLLKLEINTCLSHGIDKDIWFITSKYPHGFSFARTKHGGLHNLITIPFPRMPQCTKRLQHCHCICSKYWIVKARGKDGGLKYLRPPWSIWDCGILVGQSTHRQRNMMNDYQVNLMLQKCSLPEPCFLGSNFHQNQHAFHHNQSLFFCRVCIYAGFHAPPMNLCACENKSNN